MKSGLSEARFEPTWEEMCSGALNSAWGDLSSNDFIEPFDYLGQFLLRCSANKPSDSLYGKRSDLANLNPGLPRQISSL
jgi:hypothetical protein